VVYFLQDIREIYCEFLISTSDTSKSRSSCLLKCGHLKSRLLDGNNYWWSSSLRNLPIYMSLPTSLVEMFSLAACARRSSMHVNLTVQKCKAHSEIFSNKSALAGVLMLLRCGHPCNHSGTSVTCVLSSINLLYIIIYLSAHRSTFTTCINFTQKGDHTRNLDRNDN
jgi:hypothetical protein